MLTSTERPCPSLTPPSRGERQQAPREYNSLLRLVVFMLSIKAASADSPWDGHPSLASTVSISSMEGCTPDRYEDDLLKMGNGAVPDDYAASEKEKLRCFLARQCEWVSLRLPTDSACEPIPFPEGPCSQLPSLVVHTGDPYAPLGYNSCGQSVLGYNPSISRFFAPLKKGESVKTGSFVFKSIVEIGKNFGISPVDSALFALRQFSRLFQEERTSGIVINKSFIEKMEPVCQWFSKQLDLDPTEVSLKRYQQILIGQKLSFDTDMFLLPLSFFEKHPALQNAIGILFTLITTDQLVIPKQGNFPTQQGYEIEHFTYTVNKDLFETDPETSRHLALMKIAFSDAHQQYKIPSKGKGEL